jgi:hypothetical protein
MTRYARLHRQTRRERVSALVPVGFAEAGAFMFVRISATGEELRLLTSKDQSDFKYSIDSRFSVSVSLSFRNWL